MSKFPRGSEWRQWDLHVHSPASFHWHGKKFQNSGYGADDELLTDMMIKAMNAARPDVFAIMDYWSFDGWFALKHRMQQSCTTQLTKKVFPGIELRLCAPIKGRLNAHVLFCDEISDQQLKNFLGALKLELTNEPLSSEGLQNYARQLGEDKLKKHGFKRDDIISNDSLALKAGCQTAELNVDSYKKAIECVPDGMAVGFMPFDTNDGLDTVRLMDNYAYVMSLFRASSIFETRDEGIWNAITGRKVTSNEPYFNAFYKAMRGIPRLPVSGSDAHCFTGDGSNDRRGYGDFPSGKITWIKADPTWRGLMQAIKEPQNRCFIGEEPPKICNIRNEKSSYIDKIFLEKTASCNVGDAWFDGTCIEFNTDLVAIIGNKGSGKSALADVIALLGNSQEKESYSFLKKDRFKGKSGDPARQFIGRLIWLSGEQCASNLGDDPLPEKVEMVKYVPQGRFEALCNNHVTGSSSAFENELRDVIFSHIPREQRLGALNFDQLIEFQEKNVRAKCNELRKEIRIINEEITTVEDQLHISNISNLEEKLRLKDIQLRGMQDMKPAEVAVPSQQLTAEQQAASEQLKLLAKQDVNRQIIHRGLIKGRSKLAEKLHAAKMATDQIDFFENQFAKFSEDVSVELRKIGIRATDLVKVIITRTELELVEKSIMNAITVMDSKIKMNQAVKQQIEIDKNSALIVLNEPQKRHQTYLEALRKWSFAVEEAIGDASIPDSKIGIETRIAQVKSLPTHLKELKKVRIELSRKIYNVLVDQRTARENMFVPVQELITSNSLISEEYKLQFQSKLTFFPDAVAENVFSIVKQNVGEFRGDAESRFAVKTLYEQFNTQTGDGTIEFISTLAEKIEEASSSSDKGSIGVRAMLRKDRSPENLYDYLFGLDFVEPKYSLLFQNTPIEQLSPGQRGALLLIFYLLVDSNKQPIVLDQPEENLDNETIVNLLVPVIEEAKKNRQIIMVTHNPNLAVVCDAEQIISASFNRTDGFRINYYSGSIEDMKSNINVVNILEGTKRAFDNRNSKYFSSDQLSPYDSCQKCAEQ